MATATRLAKTCHQCSINMKFSPVIRIKAKTFRTWVYAQHSSHDIVL
jgi:hypothetical protein